MEEVRHGSNVKYAWNIVWETKEVRPGRFATYLLKRRFLAFFVGFLGVASVHPGHYMQDIPVWFAQLRSHIFLDCCQHFSETHLTVSMRCIYYIFLSLSLDHPVHHLQLHLGSFWAVLEDIWALFVLFGEFKAFCFGGGWRVETKGERKLE